MTHLAARAVDTPPLGNSVACLTTARGVRLCRGRQAPVVKGSIHRMGQAVTGRPGYLVGPGIRTIDVRVLRPRDIQNVIVDKAAAAVDQRRIG